MLILVVSVLIVLSEIVEDVAQCENTVISGPVGVAVAPALVFRANACDNVFRFGVAFDLREDKGGRRLGEDKDHNVPDQVAARLQSPWLPKSASAESASEDVENIGVNVNTFWGLLCELLQLQASVEAVLIVDSYVLGAGQSDSHERAQTLSTETAPSVPAQGGLDSGAFRSNANFAESFDAVEVANRGAIDLVGLGCVGPILFAWLLIVGNVIVVSPLTFSGGRPRFVVT